MGGEEKPEYRYRLVTAEIKKDRTHDVFAVTSPLAAKKILMPMPMTEGIGYDQGKEHQGMCLDFIDVRRAYSYAGSKRIVYVDLPPEDCEGGMCGTTGEVHAWNQRRCTKLGTRVQGVHAGHWIQQRTSIATLIFVSSKRIDLVIQYSLHIVVFTCFSKGSCCVKW